MKRVLILGGSFGGLSAAHTLRSLLPAEDEIILVDARPTFVMGFRKTSALLGESIEPVTRRLADIQPVGINVKQAAISAIDPAARAAVVNGQRLEADALVVALGTQLAPEKIPGFPQHALDVYNHHDLPRAARALRDFRGGRLAVGIFGAPFPCPPAPFEIALLVQELLQKRSVKAAIEVFTPQPMSLPILGRESCDAFEGRLAERGITFLPDRKAMAVEAGAVVFPGERRPFDLLLGIPPHRCPDVVVHSGLSGLGDWVRADKRTLETQFPGVYAVGDVTEMTLANGKPLPKSGVFAEAMGRAAAERITATFAGRAPEATFAGEGGCYLEVGGGEAMMVRGKFLTEPAPEVVLTEPARVLLEQKHAFEAVLLKRWFGR